VSKAVNEMHSQLNSEGSSLNMCECFFSYISFLRQYFSDYRITLMCWEQLLEVS
jgi:hypothetical protein